VRKDEVVAMAVVAGGCNDETAFEQTFAMDTLRIVGQNVVFGNVVDAGNRCTLSMTFAAKHGNVHFISTGLDIAGGKDVVIAVAFTAAGSIGCTAFKSAAMDSRIELLSCLIMADSAVDFIEPFRMRKILHIRILMAIDTGGVLMY